MIKTTGAEFKRFYSDPEVWKDGYYHEEEEILVDGKECYDEFGCYDLDLSAVADDARIEFQHGVILNKDNDPVTGFDTAFKKWKKKQTTVSFMVEAPKDKLEAIVAAIKADGGKVLK